MAKALGYSDVAAAAESLIKKNIRVSQRQVRKEMGNKGSYDTIQPHLSEWRKNKSMSSTDSNVSDVFPSNPAVHQCLSKIDANMDAQFNYLQNIGKELNSLSQLVRQMDRERETELAEFRRCFGMDVHNAKLKEKEHYLLNMDALVKDKNFLLEENIFLKNRIDEMLPEIQQADSFIKEVKILRMKVKKYEDYMRGFVAGHPEFEPDWADVLFTPPPPPKKGT
jgi:Mg2+ and Co2+ transporter CorA